MNYFNQEISRHDTDSVKWDAFQNEQKDKYPFWVADSDFVTVNEVIENLSKRVEHGIFGYTHAPKQLDQVIYQWYLKRNNYDLSNYNLTYLLGVVSTIAFIINEFTQENDKILIQTPVYNPFKETICANKRIVIENKLERFTYKINFDDLEDKLKEAKIFILCNPHNPTGKVYSDLELEKIVLLCKKYQVLIISDEIHSDIIYKPAKHICIGKYSHLYDKIFMLFAPSKTFNLAGLQFCVSVCFNKEFEQRLAYYVNKKLHISGPNTLAYIAAYNAYKYGETWLDEQNEYLKANLDYCLESLKKLDINLYQPQATFLLWIDLTCTKLSSKEIFEILKDEYGIIVNQGLVYGDDYDGFIRFNYATNRKNLEIGISKLQAMITKYRK